MNQSRSLKPTVLSISLLTVLAGAAVSPALAQIQKAFPDASDLAIQMILTLPPLLIIPFSLFSGWLALRFRKRVMLFVGLAFYLLAGVGGGLANSIVDAAGDAGAVRDWYGVNCTTFPIFNC